MNGEVLGYLDPLLILPAVAALVLLHLGVPAWAGASLAVAMMTKPQGLLVAPACAIAAWQTGRSRALASTALGCVLTTIVIILPYALVGALPNM